jgi:hypothetical protein
MTTGQAAWCTQYWPTEPSMASVRPPCPRLPTIRRSEPADFGDQDRSGVALDPVRDLLLYPSYGCCNSRLCAVAAELGSLRSGGHRVHARAVRWWSRDYQRTASGFPGYLTAMTSTGWIDGSLASNSAAILPSASGIGPLTCAARASSVSKVSKIP